MGIIETLLPQISRLEDIDFILRDRIGIEKTLKQIPHPNQFTDMNRAAERIALAIANNQNILIVGDYDVDGITSTIIIVDFFKQILGVNVDYIIPNRFKDGYGIKPHLIKNRQIKPDIVITVDNGITGFEASEYCLKNGIDLIITDHHTPREIEKLKAYAIVNPKMPNCTFPFEGVCGAQIAWYLCGALKNELALKDFDMGRYIQLVALAIIADIMPLKDMNRPLVKLGLQSINSNPIKVFKTIMEQKGKRKITSIDLGFLFAPMVNSIGRIADANFLVEIFMTDDDEVALELVNELEKTNQKRKELQKIGYETVMQTLDESKKGFVLHGEDLHEGVVGIIAGQIASKFEKPTIVLSKTEEGFKGSGRSVGEVNLIKFLEKNDEYLLKFGGHKEACGLTVKEELLQGFIESFEQELENYGPEDFIQDKGVVGKLKTSLISLELYNKLLRYEPFGNQNLEPKFFLEDVYISATKEMSEGKHLKLTIFIMDGVYVDALLWNYKEVISEVKQHHKYDMIVKISENTFRNKKEVQLLIDSIKENPKNYQKKTGVNLAQHSF